jgi:transcriptional repressor NrdR
MRCPKCGGLKDKVTNARGKDNDAVVRRRRECTLCNHRWTTYEIESNVLKNKDQTDELVSKFLGEEE